MIIEQTGRPEHDAQALLSAAGSTTAPHDPVRIARQLGLEVYLGGVTADTAGMLVKRYGEDASIYLNSFDSTRRQRFTCAHELGHFVRRNELSEDWQAVDKRDYASTTGFDPEERYANQFAAALLMPAGEVREMRARGLTSTQLAQHFDVSAEAMRYRIANLTSMGAL